MIRRWLKRIVISTAVVLVVLVGGLTGAGFALSRLHHPRSFPAIAPSPRLQLDGVTVVNPVDGTQTPNQSVLRVPTS